MGKNESVMVFIPRFRAVIPRNYTEHQRIQAFISKLPVNLQHSLNLRQPATFSQAVRIAKELEAPLRYSKQKVIGALTASAGVNQDGDGAQQEDVDFLGRTKEQRQIVKLLKKTEHLEATIMAFVTKLGPPLRQSVHLLWQARPSTGDLLDPQPRPEAERLRQHQVASA